MGYTLLARKAAPTVGFIGDSITAGTLVDANPPDVFATLAGVAVCNQGVSGSTSGSWVPGGANYTAAKAAFQSAGVGIVHIMLGTNDAKTSVATTAAQYRANLRAICDDLTDAGMRVAVSYPPYLGATSGEFDAGSPARVTAYCGAIDALGLPGDRIANSYFRLTGLQPDNVHPVQSGSDFLGHLWWHALRPMLAEPVYVGIGAGLAVSVVDGVPTLAAATGATQPEPAPTPVITWNPEDKGAVTLSGALATKAAGNGWASARATPAFTTGGDTDLSFGVEIVGDTQVIVGVMQSQAALGSFVGADAYGWGFYANNGSKAHGGALVGYGPACVVGDRITVNLSRAGVLSFARNGVPLGDAYTGLSGSFLPAVAVFTGAVSGGRLL